MWFADVCSPFPGWNLWMCYSSQEESSRQQMHTNQRPIKYSSLMEKTPCYIVSPDKVLCLIQPFQHHSCSTKKFGKISARRYPTTGVQLGLCLLSDKHNANNRTLFEGEGVVAGYSSLLFWLVTGFIRFMSPLAFSPFFLEQISVISDSLSRVTLHRGVQRYCRARKFF